MASFDNINQCLKRANHFAPRRKKTHLQQLLEISRRKLLKDNLQRYLIEVGVPNATLLWDASDDYLSKLITIDEIARGLNRFVDENRAATHLPYSMVVRWWRDLLFFDPRNL